MRLIAILMALVLCAPLLAAAEPRRGGREYSRAAFDRAQAREMRRERIEFAREQFGLWRTVRARERLAAWREELEQRRAVRRELFERGRRGERFLRGEILALDPSPEALERARSMSFSIGRERVLPRLGMRLVVLRAPEGMSVPDALDALQRSDPEGLYEANHVYGPSGAASGDPPARADPPAVAQTPANVRIGMIDTGVDRDHPSLKNARLRTRAFPRDTAYAAAPHGTAVASLLVGEDERFQGLLPGAELFAADVFGERPEGGSAEDIAAAMAWLVSEDVQVLNISLAGPPSRLIEALCRRAASAGVVVVAAVGNDGPTEPVAFPAAYESVIGVTAVDKKQRVYIAANRGPEVDFAAAGVSVRAATPGGGYVAVSGTSFAAPMVVARLAALNPAERSVERLAQQARDLGAPGRDDTYGYGAI